MSVGPAVAAAHRCAAAVLRPGDRAVDATAGNGHDTLFLARAVGPAGGVLALDRQEAAIAATRDRLRAAGLEARVRLRRAGHEGLVARAPAGWPGRVRALLFNLGYLPGGDRGIRTRPATTLAALDAALELLAPGGRLAVVAYPGHPGGGEEADAVAAWMEARAGGGDRLLADGRRRYGASHRAPRLAVVERGIAGPRVTGARPRRRVW